MLRDIISTIATCNIFWSADFRQWRVAVDQMYPDSIDSITNYGIFQVFRNDKKVVNIYKRWNLKYVS